MKFSKTEHIDELPFTVVGGLPEDVVYIRVGADQYWKNPKGGWDKTIYYDVIETIENLNRTAEL